jgi:phosphoglycerate dehydrogenase-like enzyme
MFYRRRKSDLKKIVFATTKDRPFFNELWNEHSREKAAELGFEIVIPDGTAETVSRHWPELLADTEGIITTWNSPRIDENILRANNKLKIIGHAAGSVADYVSPEVFEREIAVCSSNSDMAHSVAEWCLMAALMGIRQVMNYTKFGSLGGLLDWPGRHRCGTVQNATIGFWGYGAIATALHGMLKPLAPGKILVASNHLNDLDAISAGMNKVALEELFKKSDIIFLLTGLNEKTEGKIDSELLASIKDGAVLVNAGRGQLIQEKALFDELRKERFTGVFDVFHQEPLPLDNTLRSMSNVILTPHNAGYPSRTNYVSTILEEFDRFFNGAPLKYQVKEEKIKFMTLNLSA